MPLHLSLFVLAIGIWPALGLAQGTAAAGHMLPGDGFILFGAPALGSVILLAALLFGRQWKLALQGVAWCSAYIGALVVRTDAIGGVGNSEGAVILVLFALAPAFFFVVFSICAVIAVRRSKATADAA